MLAMTGPTGGPPPSCGMVFPRDNAVTAGDGVFAGAPHAAAGPGPAEGENSLADAFAALVAGLAGSDAAARAGAADAAASAEAGAPGGADHPDADPEPERTDAWPPEALAAGAAPQIPTLVNPLPLAWQLTLAAGEPAIEQSIEAVAVDPVMIDEPNRDAAAPGDRRVAQVATAPAAPGAPAVNEPAVALPAAIVPDNAPRAVHPAADQAPRGDDAATTAVPAGSPPAALAATGSPLDPPPPVESAVVDDGLVAAEPPRADRPVPERSATHPSRGAERPEAASQTPAPPVSSATPAVSRPAVPETPGVEPHSMGRATGPTTPFTTDQAAAERDAVPAAAIASESGDEGADPPDQGEDASYQPPAGQPRRFGRVEDMVRELDRQAAEASSGAARPVAAEARVSALRPAAPAAPAQAPAAALPAEPLPQNVASIVQGLRVQIRQGISEAIVRLQPEHFGEVTIAIRLERGLISAQVSAESTGVCDWLAGQEESIRHNLSEHGLQLERFVVQRDRPRERREAPPQHQNRQRTRQSEAEEPPRFEVAA